MRVCLVYPHPGEPSGLNVPHGLLQLAAQLKASGHQAVIADYNGADTGLPYDRLREFDAVGLSVTTPQLRQAVEIVDSLQDSVPIVWGGVHAFLDPASILNRFPGHYVVNGEGEVPLVGLLDCLQQHGRDPARLRALPGLCFKDGDLHLSEPFFNPDLGALADVDYHDLPCLEQYLHQDIYFCRDKVWALDILTSRGCHWKCSFCINTLVARCGGKYRSKPIEKLRRETEPIIDEFGLHFVLPRDEDFFLNKRLVDDWMAYAKEKGFFWSSNCRYNYFNGKVLDEARLTELVDGGLFQIGMSIEAGDETIRNKVLNKVVRDSDIDRAVRVIRDTVGDRLAVNTSFIINFPGDTAQSRIRMLQLMSWLSGVLNITFTGPQVYRPYPGSRLAELGPGQQKGNLDFYMGSIADWSTASGLVVGAPQQLLDSEAYFYTHVARTVLNQRYRFFRYVPGEGRGTLEPAGRGGRHRGATLLMIRLISLLFLPILLRLRTGNFRCFIEPFVLGTLARLADQFMATLRRILR